MSGHKGAVKTFVNNCLARGRVSFSFEEIIEKTGLTVIAAKKQLEHLAEVVRVTPRQPYFLVVSPEHSIVGAPPVDWWLDDYFKWLGEPYYIALLSAASELGSSHQAVMTTQVITSRPRKTITHGRIRIRFFMKSKAGNTVIQQCHGSYAPLKMSSLESTLFDLIRYATEIGGIERAAETMLPLLKAVSPKELKAVLDVEAEVSTTQRLGFVLEVLGYPKLAQTVQEWLPDNLHLVPISTQCKVAPTAPVNRKWRIVNNTRSFL